MKVVFLGLMIILTGCSSSDNFLEHNIDWTQEQKNLDVGNKKHILPSEKSIAEKIEYLDLSKAIQLTIEYNPELRMHKKSVLQIGAEGRQADLYPNPTLELFVGEVEMDTGEGFRNSEIGIGISQEIILGKEKFYSVQALSKEQKAALASFYAVRREVIARVKKSFVSVLYLQESLKLAQSLKSNAETLVDILQAKYNEGILSEVQLLSAKTFLAKRKGDSASFSQKLTLSKKQLAADIGDLRLANKNCVGEFAPIFYPYDLEQLKTLAMKNPQIIEAQYKIEKQESLLSAAKAKRVPNITLFLGYQRNEATDINTAQMGLSIPLPIFDRNQGKIASQQLAVESSQANLKHIQNNLLSQLEFLYTSLQEIQKQIEILQNNTMPLAKKSLEIAKLEFEEGRQSFLLYLEANRAYHEVQSDYLQAVKKTNDIQIELERLLGTTSILINEKP